MERQDLGKFFYYFSFLRVVPELLFSCIVPRRREISLTRVPLFSTMGNRIAGKKQNQTGVIFYFLLDHLFGDKGD